MSNLSYILLQCYCTVINYNLVIFLYIRLLPWVNRALYEQITNWVVFGSLFDPREEFFIQNKANSETEVDGIFKPPKFDTNKTNGKYIVNFSVVPSHFPVPLTERILFVGYAIGIIRNSESEHNYYILCLFLLKN